MLPEIIAKLQEQPPGDALLEALKDLLHHDSFLLRVDANERSIAYRLGMHLQSSFPKWHVDCEYNRDGVDPKKISHLGLYPNEEDSDARTAFPDIIVHRRGTPDNFLVLELKKSTNKTDRAVDFAKLRGYKRCLGFKFAAYLEFATGGQAGISDLEWVDDV
jgi:hypothetical protein